ncbi:MAG: MltA domain-containing protein [Planctomycetes bacterium]|nr:MltA domain-containing protein [Planctomycetota bacterium]
MRYLYACLVAALLAGCSSTDKDYSRPLPPGKMALEKITDPALYPDFSKGWGDKETLMASIDYSLSYYEKPSSKKYFPYLDISHDRAVASLHAMKALLQSCTSGAELNSRIAAEFDIYRSVGWDGSGEMLFTGYCEPIYDASLTRTDKFRFPLYGKPEELIKDDDGMPIGWRHKDGTIGSSPKRVDFDSGCIAGRGLEIAWLADPMDVYVVQVQGSARMKLEDGTMMQVGYAGKTEYPYGSIGKQLIRDEKIEKKHLSLRAIRSYFHEHPDELNHYLQVNNCYVFFRQAEGGPYGSLGVKVTPYRSIATDKGVFPRGGVAYLVGKLPEVRKGERNGEHEFCQFLMDQDTGGGIRSAGRADIFLGTGPDAEMLAGAVGDEGLLYYVFVKETGVKVAEK